MLSLKNKTLAMCEKKVAVYFEIDAYISTIFQIYFCVSKKKNPEKRIFGFTQD